MNIFKYITSFVLLLFTISSCSFLQYENESFRFSVLADSRGYTGEEYDSPEYFRGILEALKKVGTGKFMITPGDMDPPSGVRWSIDKYLGKDFIWYPVLGNHEEETSNDMTYLRKYNNGDKLPNIVNNGPKGSEETMYSFDFGNSHFVVLNEYYDGNSDVAADGDINEYVYKWLQNDLEKTNATNVFVFGHEPAFVQPDQYSGRLRHNGDSLGKYRKNRDRFWNLLEKENVIAYFCGHTHNYSSILINNVWQIDAGHARGKDDLDSPSTFLTVDVNYDEVTVTVYRDIHDGTYDYKDIVKTYRIK
jgi:hypothetical protein